MILSSVAMSAAREGRSLTYGRGSDSAKQNRDLSLDRKGAQRLQRADDKIIRPTNWKATSASVNAALPSSFVVGHFLRTPAKEDCAAYHMAGGWRMEARRAELTHQIRYATSPAAMMTNAISEGFVWVTRASAMNQIETATKNHNVYG